MRKVALPLLVLGTLSTAAAAEEPLVLTSEQMDQVTAGIFTVNGESSLSSFAVAIASAEVFNTDAANINQNVNAIAINLGDDDDDFPPGQGGD